ncbi:Flavin-dependent oxidoreductase, luciferase family (includes alkanesulfonate monooxygenase SsuD and methylene tetrahydromethanopterin reductase) [Nakamurella panacisegetis]|uniref:Flavin-dependent oxidoreductase, luciferase family (Includes alkanesulfonate monooxygenase SsuD and methylene tetrahydromethanopterin reductase) n=1 Tax=Nakamurella panacisegetis TaxID=1090615 RepID=A0A1H0JCV9_9ACTN|nr:LLM class flavin-dependent oxidoreductase [Nakamurella panacisegetis]SDO41299.1 Flavin-dependent oxidoreductase, luciferase family (includes alkanesulfonate monooxygenase SsuD and methylene tetrahydromethanopterin reductase) [Nakamurella panacisegetis]
MPDYQHDLLFGTFGASSSADPDGAVELAVAADEAGLDLVTFQDHPYQPALLDTWTLMSYVAARTTRIRITGNVLNLPLRPPAVLARAAAALDRLSGGRVELGLGSGAFWDAIDAMGGRRRTPGESVEALAEAIGVIRAIWDTSEKGGVFRSGEHYPVHGAKRGPAPQHDISIWLGAYKPRMLRLVGSLADGWLPSVGYLPSIGALADGNAEIDEAAATAGRDPRRIRRLLNIRPEDVDVNRLADWALEYGVSVFIAPGDDLRTIEHYAAEIAPAVRESVERARTQAPPPEPAPAEHGPVEVAGPVTGEFARPVTGEVTVPAALGVTPTPDDGARLLPTTRWDESARPFPPIPDGIRYSDRGRAVAGHLIDVHNHLRSELEQLRDVIAQVRAGLLDPGVARSAINAMTMRQNEWTVGAFCASYCRLVTTHHSLEDSGIFPHLRHADAAVAPTIDRLQAEHLVIHDVLEDVDAALVMFIRDPSTHAGLQRAVDSLTDTLLSHLSYEERALVEPLARYGMAPGQV